MSGLLKVDESVSVFIMPLGVCYDSQNTFHWCHPPLKEELTMVGEPELIQKADNDKKRKKEVPVEKKKKARKNLTLDLPKQQGTLDKWLKLKRVRFSKNVWLKSELHCITIPLTGYSLRQSPFYIKRLEQKQRMKQNHQKKVMTPRHLKRQQYIRETLAKYGD